MKATVLAAVASACLLAFDGSGTAFAQTARPELAYQVQEGRNLNAFVRQGPVAAHLILRSGVDPRIIAAFPAGNSGVGLWFDRLEASTQWTLLADPVPTEIADAEGRVLHGIRADIAIDAQRLTVRKAVLSNVRFLRDYEAIAKVPEGLEPTVTVTGDRIVFARDRIDGAPGYRLDIRVTEGRMDGQTLIAGLDGRIRLEMVALTGDAPLTPLVEADLLNDKAADDTEARQALTFLSYDEKFLAGSWRFNTYFGRDTLMSLRLLMPALQPHAVEAGLESVLARLNADGEVAHEEGLSEFALVDRRDKGEPASDAAILDYAMVDDDFMLAPVARAYLLDSADPASAQAFLAQPLRRESEPDRSETVGQALVRNLRFVLAQAAPFAADPVYSNLISLKPDRMAGQWRDSNEGIGRGRYAYDVNAVFVPAALLTASDLFSSGMLDPYLTDADRRALAQATEAATIWRDRVPGMFLITTPAASARSEIADYGRTLGLPVDAALSSLGEAALRFHGIALDAQGQPVPIINSDEGFDLLFADPGPEQLDLAVESIMRPFPAGLMTDVGLLVANPAQADATVEARFSPQEYHGAVIWSWQQALLAAGLERQLARANLPPPTRDRLVKAQTDLWTVIQAGNQVRNSELWSWTWADGRYQVAPFGAAADDVDESNAAQLWSTVYLAVRPPAAFTTVTGTR
ncbi:hypothetical protein BZG35_16760 [Brevundimonas sp. LM2]|uniref:hypothetical protein n=1 Tax=Brevundimonas sp. LM2 TaxID=1938605 RepID=UPI000983D19A|nr:hypothetical protein [Brevundimonas sp. LM2]AQR63116.1 hypothetical protein BZG35_16760 [Brevundimonas sp. LM2]